MNEQGRPVTTRASLRHRSKQKEHPGVADNDGVPSSVRRTSQSVPARGLGLRRMVLNPHAGYDGSRALEERANEGQWMPMRRRGRVEKHG